MLLLPINSSEDEDGCLRVKQDGNKEKTICWNKLITLRYSVSVSVFSPSPHLFFVLLELPGNPWILSQDFHYLLQAPIIKIILKLLFLLVYKSFSSICFCLPSYSYFQAFGCRSLNSTSRPSREKEMKLF